MYFEPIDAIKRIILSSCLGFVGSSPTRAAVGCVVSFVFLVIQRESMPYPSNDVNFLHCWAQFLITGAFFIGLVVTGKPFAYNGPAVGFTLVIGCASLVALAFGCYHGMFKTQKNTTSKVAVANVCETIALVYDDGEKKNNL